jgi:hypothetical protein
MMLKKIALFTASLLAATSASATIVTIDWRAVDNTGVGRVVYDSTTPRDPQGDTTFGTPFARQTLQSQWDFFGILYLLPATPYVAYNQQSGTDTVNLLTFTTAPGYDFANLPGWQMFVTFATSQRIWGADGGLPSSGIETRDCGICGQAIFGIRDNDGLLYSQAITYTASYSNPVGAVPEPATWAMMIGGFGMVGGAMRRRRASTRTTVSFA